MTSTIKQSIINQLELVLSSYSPYLEALNEQGRKDYEELNQCLLILRSSKIESNIRNLVVESGIKYPLSEECASVSNLDDDINLDLISEIKGFRNN